MSNPCTQESIIQYIKERVESIDNKVDDRFNSIEEKVDFLVEQHNKNIGFKKALSFLGNGIIACIAWLIGLMSK